MEKEEFVMPQALAASWSDQVQAGNRERADLFGGMARRAVGVRAEAPGF